MSDIFDEIKRRDLSLVYGPLDSHPYKVELKHESWRNVGLVSIKSLFDHFCYSIVSKNGV